MGLRFLETFFERDVTGSWRALLQQDGGFWSKIEKEWLEGERDLYIVVITLEGTRSRSDWGTGRRPGAQTHDAWADGN